jgi:hypothetical protein
MKKFSPPQMKEVSFPTPHTLFPVRRQERIFKEKAKKRTVK